MLTMNTLKEQAFMMLAHAGCQEQFDKVVAAVNKAKADGGESLKDLITVEVKRETSTRSARNRNKHTVQPADRWTAAYEAGTGRRHSGAGKANSAKPGAGGASG